MEQMSAAKVTLLGNPVTSRLYTAFYGAMRRLTAASGRWILGRHACLARQILADASVRIPVINIQKGRVDYLCDVAENPAIKPRIHEAVPYIARPFAPFLVQQTIAWHRFPKPPVALVMDSFAELTDQLFVHREAGWRFCCHYGEITDRARCDILFAPCGLLPVADLYDHYVRFFSVVRRHYRSIPIIFLHFPGALETRQRFRERHAAILEVIDRVALLFPPFYSVAVEESIVDWPEGGPEVFNTPYHYNAATYRVFLAALRNVGAASVLQ